MQTNGTPPNSKTAAITAANCPSCGGELSIPERVEYVKCTYCRTSVKVREAAVSDTPLTAPASAPPAGTQSDPQISQDRPWYRTSWALWAAFFFFLPAWVVLVLSDPKQPRFLKIIAWVLVGLMAYSILVSTIT